MTEYKSPESHPDSLIYRIYNLNDDKINLVEKILSIKACHVLGLV